MSADPVTPKRQAQCGWFTRGDDVELRSVNGCVYPAQLIVCGRAWTEPVCGAKIRSRKAVELANLIAAHGTPTKGPISIGGGVSLVTFTLEHHAADSLESTLSALRAAWDKVIHCRRYERLRAACGLWGMVVAYEFTHGANGWHPHLHVLFFHGEALDAHGLTSFTLHMRQRWELGASLAGRTVHPRLGVDLRLNAEGSDVGGYIAKVQEGDWGPAQEITRGDAKASHRESSRTPFTILRDHYAAVRESGGTVESMADWELWQEYSAATLINGKRSIPLCRMTPGLRKRILGDDAEPELSAEQLALVEVGGELIAVMPRETWAAVRRARLGPAVLAAGEAGGLDAINVLLASRKLGQAYPPDAVGRSGR